MNFKEAAFQISGHICLMSIILLFLILNMTGPFCGMVFYRVENELNFLWVNSIVLYIKNVSSNLEYKFQPTRNIAYANTNRFWCNVIKQKMNEQEEKCFWVQQKILITITMHYRTVKMIGMGCMG